MTKKLKKEQSDFTVFYSAYFGQIIDFEQPSPPKPDIIFHLDGKIIGCELTTIFKDNLPGEKGSNSKKAESIHDKICDSLKSWVVQNIPVKLFIRITFDHKNIEGNQIDTVTNKLISILKIIIPEMNLSEKCYIKVDQYDKMPLGVHSLSIRFSPANSKTDVTPAAGDSIPKLSNDRILSNIRHKEDKLLKNNNLYNENWLLLVIQDNLFSSEFDINEKDTFPRFESKFDRVFLLLKSHKKIIPLKDLNTDLK